MNDTTSKLEHVEQANKLLSECPFGGFWKFEVISVQPNVVVCGLRARPELFRPGGVLQGGCLMTLADVAFWLAAMTQLGTDTPAVTLEMKTNFLRGATGNILCRAEVMTCGRRVVYGTASSTDENGKLLAHHTLTYLRP